MKNSRNKYNPDIHHRRSIRMKGHDYSQPGLYFITICVQNRKCLFGEIIDGEMVLNESGHMVEKWYFELENKYPDKICREMIVMPNHFHCVIENANHPQMNVAGLLHQDVHVGTSLRGRPGANNDDPDSGKTEYGIHNKKYNSTVGDAMDWFKTMTTNEYIRGVKQLGWKPFDRKLWQRNYWEHIIRDEISYRRIVQYIMNNPTNWLGDKLNPASKKIIKGNG